jgi:CRP/FNR family cyclic AMP-dependent transcriptional regulator
MGEVFHAADIFGEIRVIDRGSPPRLRSAKYGWSKLPDPAFLAALASSEPLADAPCRMLALRPRRTFELFQDATFETLEVRLARKILCLTERGGRQIVQGLRVSDRLRQADLADLLGPTTRGDITTLDSSRAIKFARYDTDRTFLLARDGGAPRKIIGAESE